MLLDSVRKDSIPAKRKKARRNLGFKRNKKESLSLEGYKMIKRKSTEHPEDLKDNFQVISEVGRKQLRIKGFTRQ